MRRKGQGSASISAVVVFLSALLALGLMATILPPVANVLSGFREGLRERGERGSELIRIYIHTANETELEPPIITIINGYDRESILIDYVVVARDGRVLAAGKMGGSLGGIRIPAGARIDLTPADFGLSYGTFAAMADEVKAIYIRTAEGNSFGSSYGPPPKIDPDYQLKISQRSQHIIVIGSTTTRYNFTILGNFTLPTTGDAMVVRNVILVDKDGFVRGGVTAGSKWSDGSFDPNKIPDSVAALSKTDVVPIGGYYFVPPFPTDFYCYYSQGVFSVYSGCDTNPRYIEMVEFYPVEYYTPGSPVGVAAYYARYGGETQTVYNPDLGRVVTVTAQRPMTVQYGYGIPGTYTLTVPTIATSTYTTTVTATTTSTYTVLSTSTTTSISNYRQSGQCTAPSGYNLYCSFTINPPSGSFVVRAIKEVGYTVSGSGGSYICSTSVGSGIQYVKVTTPWGTYTFTSTSWSTSGNFPVGSVTFELAVYYSWVSMGCSATITGWVVYELLNYVTTVSTSTATTTYLVARTTLGTTTYSTTTMVPVSVWAEGALVKFAPASGPRMTATATLAISGSLKDQVKGAVVSGTQTPSGDAVARLAGTVQGGQVIKVKAPIVLLNYVYGIAASPPAPPSGGGGGGGEIGMSYVCTVDQSVQSINPPPSDTSSSGSSTNQPLESISGGTVTNFSVQQNTVQVLRNVVCRPVTLPRGPI
jgi:hypothetical protein